MSWRRQASAAEDILVRALGERGDSGASTITYTAPGGSPVDVFGIYLDAHSELDVESETGVSTVQPSVQFKIADLPEYPPAKAATITITRPQGDPQGAGSQTFRISDHHPDGEGMVALMLTKTT